MAMKPPYLRNHAVVVFVPLKAQFFSFNMDGMSGPDLHGFHVFPVADKSTPALMFHTFITQVAGNGFDQFQSFFVVLRIAL